MTFCVETCKFPCLLMTNLLHFARLVGLVYKAAAVLIHHKQTQGVNILFSAQHHGKHRYHTENKEAKKQN